MTESTIETQPGKFMRYTAVSCARWRNVDPHAYIDSAAEKMGADPDALRQLFFNATQWAFDNQDQARKLWGDR